MRKEVTDFYRNHRIPVDRMVQVGVRRRGLTSDSIKSAAEEVYNEIQAGTLNAKPIQLAWIVYGRSKHGSTPASNATVYDMMLKLEAKLDEYMTPWYVKFWRKFK